ncbi:Pcl7p [Nakaseomyces bracarensis]|uniref:Pcl7p n=1 Tax=Nakaseomyces bracarensis TaxID=273131 RepID=UPI0038724E71
MSSYSVRGDESSAPIGIPIPNTRIGGEESRRESVDSIYPRPTPTGSGYLPMGTSVTTEETLASSQSSHSPFRDNTLLQTNSIASTSHLANGVEVIQSPIDHAEESAMLMRESLSGPSIRPKFCGIDRDSTVIGGLPVASDAAIHNDTSKNSTDNNNDSTGLCNNTTNDNEHINEHNVRTIETNDDEEDMVEQDNDDDYDDTKRSAVPVVKDEEQLMRNHDEQIRYIRAHYNVKRNQEIDDTDSNGDADGEAADTTSDTVEEDLNIAEFPTDKLLEMLTALLTKIIKSNDDIDPKDEVDMMTLLNSEHSPEKEKYLKSIMSFKGKHVPQITLYQYFQRIQKYCPTTNDVFLSLLVYFDRISKKCNAADDSTPSASQQQLFVMDSYNIHRLVIAGVTVCTKFFSDFFYSNSRYARVGGISLQELNHLEIQFLILCDFELLIPVDKLQRYANLLLRFWNNQEDI